MSDDEPPSSSSERTVSPESTTSRGAVESTTRKVSAVLAAKKGSAASTSKKRVVSKKTGAVVLKTKKGAAASAASKRAASSKEGVASVPEKPNGQTDPIVESGSDDEQSEQETDDLRSPSIGHPNHVGVRKDNTSYTQYQRACPMPELPSALQAYLPTTWHRAHEKQQRKDLVEKTKELFHGQYSTNQALQAGSDKARNVAIYQGVLNFFRSQGIADSDAVQWPFDETKRMIKNFLANAKAAAGFSSKEPGAKPRFKRAPSGMITGDGPEFRFLERLWSRMADIPDSHPGLQSQEMLDRAITTFRNTFRNA
ncbi:Uncharacterized protein PBTT_09003 [Plasmodiophora brassicae]|uniref:Uncharacterized protein n=1 Tax=Plasmodiophora brassicae TaxID=37360 RepID=A0A3P3YL10_PLABS|nr:unnamed protein product [Plasmodiophora brassicae]